MRSDVSIAQTRVLPPPSADRWLVGIFLLLLAVPGVLGLSGQGVRQAILAGEPPPRRPSLGSATTVAGWMQDLQAYARVSFGLRQELIRADAELKHGLGLGQSYGSAVTRGREGWLFYRVHRGSQGVRPEEPFSAEELSRWVKAIEERRRLVEARGATFLFLATPDKETIYPDLLPPELPAGRSVSRLDALLARLRSSGVLVVDLRPALHAARAAGSPLSHWPLYYRTDDHWNALGALVGSRALLAELGSRFPGLHVPAEADLHVEAIPVGGGDLARMEGLQDAARDVFLRFDRSGPCAFDPFHGSIPPSPETPLQQAQTLECPGAPIGRGLILHDSMMVAMIPHLAPAFRRSTWRLTPTLDPALLDAEAPDVVILELVERTLWEGLPGW